MSTNIQRIKERYQYMFKAKNLGIYIPTGWLPTFERLCNDIDEILGPDKRDFSFIQCKEKFGSGRWYCKLSKVKQRMPVDIQDNEGVVMSLSVPDTRKKTVTLGEQIGKLVHEAEERTMHLCIVCGEPSRVDTFDGYMLQLCAAHKKMRRKGTLPSFWEEDDELEPP